MNLGHAVNLVRAAWHEAKKRHPGLAFLAGERERSPEWRHVEAKFLADHPHCAGCGTTSRLNVHHKLPFHLHPEMELEPRNLITLCMSTKECHLRLGHGGNFQAWNPNVLVDCALVMMHPEKRAEIEARAKEHRRTED